MTTIKCQQPQLAKQRQLNQERQGSQQSLYIHLLNLDSQPTALLRTWGLVMMGCHSLSQKDLEQLTIGIKR